MRKKVRMTFRKGVNTRGYKGHWEMNYHVENVVDAETNELICEEYVFTHGCKIEDICGDIDAEKK